MADEDMELLEAETRDVAEDDVGGWDGWQGKTVATIIGGLTLAIILGALNQFRGGASASDLEDEKQARIAAIKVEKIERKAEDKELKEAVEKVADAVGEHVRVDAESRVSIEKDVEFIKGALKRIEEKM